MLRAARSSELEALSALALRSKAVWNYPHEFLDACRDELTLDEGDLGGTFVKELDGTIVGFYTVSRCGTGQVELDYLFVEPWALRRGHGRDLIEHAKQRARAGGDGVMFVQGDPHAEAFYLTAGARRVGVRASRSIPGRVLPLYEIELTGSGNAAHDLDV